MRCVVVMGICGLFALGVRGQSNIFALVGSNSNKITKFDLSTPGTKTEYATSLPVGIYGLAVTGSGSFVYFTGASSKIYKLNLGATGNTPSTIAGAASGYQDGTGTSAQFRNPLGIALSPDETYLLIVDSDANAIRHLLLSNNAVSTIVGNTCTNGASGGCTAGFIDGAGTSSRLDNPQDIVFHPSGTYALFVEFNNHRVRRIDLRTNFLYTVTTICGTGTAGTVDGSCSTAQFNYPYQISMSGDGDVFYVATHGSPKKIRKLTLSSATVLEIHSTTDNIQGMANTVLNDYVLYSDFANSKIKKFVSSATDFAASITTPYDVHIWRCNTAGYGSDTVSETCVQCPAGKYGGGTSGTGGRCVTCAVGSWSAAGASTCTWCADGTYRTTTGGTAASDCTSCGSGLWSAPGSSSSSACIGCVELSGSAISTGGGTETTDVPGYRVHQYLVSGGVTTTVSGVTFARDTVADVLVVGGGGAGGKNSGAGGGAGAVAFYSGFKFTGGTQYTLVIGNGGAISSSTTACGNSGDDSAILSGATVLFAAKGGGGGGPLLYNGCNGGSAGGGAACDTSATCAVGVSGTVLTTNMLSSISGYTMGKAGGNGNQVTDSVWDKSNAGGGGGAGQAGSTATASSPGTGGDGIYTVSWAGITLTLSSLFGSAYTGIAQISSGNFYIGGGGGGGGYQTSGSTSISGGKGGGGTGIDSKSVNTATKGLDNTGSGGGGGAGTNSNGGAGGSGLILLRYSTCQACGAGQKLVNAGASGSCQACGGGEYSWSGASSCGSCPDNSVSNKGLGSDKCVASAGKYPLHTAPASYTTTSSTVTVTGKLFVVNNDYVGGSFWGLSGTVYVHIDPFANLAALIASPTILPAISDNDYPVVTDSAGAVVRPYAWWKFDSAGCKTDSSGNNYHLTTGGTEATCASSFVKRGDTASNFVSSSSQSFKVPRTMGLPAIQAASGITIVFWFLASTSSASYARIFDFSVGADNTAVDTSCLISRRDTANTIRLEIGSTTYTTANAVVDGQWHHFCWSVSTGGDWRIWLDGTQVVGTSAESFTAANQKNANLPTPASGKDYQYYLGRQPSSADYLTGNLDDFRIYKTVLTTAQVTTLYQGRVGVYTASFGNCPDTTTCTTGSKHCDKFGGKQCCVAGQYLQDGVDSACQSCPAGTYSLDGAGTSCTVCPNGKYVTTTGSTSSAACTDCTATACASGYKRCKTSTTYECCGANTYFIEGTGMTACETCPTGLFSSGGGVTCITQCPAGQYEDAGACQGCPVGMFNAGP